MSDAIKRDMNLEENVAQDAVSLKDLVDGPAEESAPGQRNSTIIIHLVFYLQNVEEGRMSSGNSTAQHFFKRVLLDCC